MRKLFVNAAVFCLLVGFLFTPNANAAEAEKPETLNIGNLDLLILRDADVTMEQKLLPGLDTHPEYIPLFERGPVPAVDQVFFLRDGDHNILIDTGWGSDGKIQGKTLGILKEEGISPEEITDIILTHMDLDHIGGLVSGDKAVFPRAILWISKPEYEAWDTGNVKRPSAAKALAKKVIELYRDRIKLFNYGENFLPAITALDASGHTPGHTAYLIKSGNDEMIIAGDLIHIAQVQLPLPDMSTTYDMDMTKAAQSRKNILEKVTSEKSKLAGMHFPMVGRVLKRDDGGYMMMEPRR